MRREDHECPSTQQGKAVGEERTALAKGAGHGQALLGEGSLEGWSKATRCFSCKAVCSVSSVAPNFLSNSKTKGGNRWASEQFIALRDRIL